MRRKGKDDYRPQLLFQTKACSLDTLKSGHKYEYIHYSAYLIPLMYGALTIAILAIRSLL